MKRFFLIILMIFTMMVSSCGTTNYVSQRTINEMDRITYVLYNNYPQLHYYFMEGVMDVIYLKEVTLEDGTIDYKIKYRFLRYYYKNYADKIEAVKEYYPELYEMYLNGVIEITSLYKYVDKHTGKIQHHISYRRIYDYQYRYYPRLGGSHIYYNPKPTPPRRPGVRPNNNHKPHNNGNRPQQRRNNSGRRR